MAREQSGAGLGTAPTPAGTSFGPVPSPGKSKKPSKPPKQASNADVSMGREAVEKLVRQLIGDASENQKLKFDALQSEISNKLSRLEHMPTTPVLAQWAVGIIIALVALFLTMMGLFGDRWETGLGDGAVIGEKLSNADKKIDDTNRNLDRLIEKIDRVMEQDARKK